MAAKALLKIRSVSLPQGLFDEAAKIVNKKNKDKLQTGKFTVNKAICEGLRLWITTERAATKKITMSDL